MDHLAKKGPFEEAYFKAKVVSWLERGGDINETRLWKEGHTLLMIACIQNHEALCAELLQRGAALDMKGKGGKTALMHAAIHGNKGCVDMLLQAGARANIRADVDDSDFTEFDGLTARECVEEQLRITGKRPRLPEIVHMLQVAEALQQQHDAQRR